MTESVDYYLIINGRKKDVNYRYPEGYRLPKGGWLGHKTKVWKQTYVGKVMTPLGLPPQILAIVATS
jgi:hypothetical protein